MMTGNLGLVAWLLALGGVACAGRSPSGLDKDAAGVGATGGSGANMGGTTGRRTPRAVS